jgi:ATP-binding cassette subfamily B protein
MGIVFVLWAGGALINIKALEIGKLIAFINYLRQMLWSLMMVSNLLMRISRAQVSAFRIQGVFARKPAIPRARHPVMPGSVKKGIEFCHVSFSYTADLTDPALKNISFKAEPGQTTAIMGATGSGKSTLIHLIPRFYDVTGGSIYIDGKDIRDLDLTSVRRRVGIVMQETILFRGTIRRNILYALDNKEGQYSREELEERMRQAARTAMIADFIERLPDGYDTDIHQRGVNLSGGQKQRIAIARALAAEPSILIFDDATNALDSTTELDIYEALQRQKSMQIRFIITQRISSVLTADTILILENGRIAGSGTHKRLLSNNSIYQDIYTSQYGRNHQETADGK